MKQSINKLMLLLFSSFLLSTSIYANNEDYFIFTVEGSNFTISTYLDDFYNVKCDTDLDFVEEQYRQEDYTCVYDDGGYHTITIYPITFRYMSVLIGSTTNREKIRSIEQWGTNDWDSLENAFLSVPNLQVNALDSPNLRYATSLVYMFNGATFNNDSLMDWDVSGVTNMEGMLLNVKLNATITLNRWDVSRVTNMGHMFQGADAFEGLYAWNVSNVTNMHKMFYGSSFRRSIGQWDTSKVTDMSYMFKNASFNYPIGDWNVSSVDNMTEMFNNASLFNRNIGNWNVSSVKNIEGMFNGATAFNQDIGDWNISGVSNMEGMFSEATAFNQDIGNWDVSGVSNMVVMFYKATAFNHDIGDWDVSNVDNMTFMFHKATAFNQDIGDWDISKVTNMYYMFDSAHPMSISNYDNLLLSWNARTHQFNVPFSAGIESNYCVGVNVRARLIQDDGWDIEDGNDACPYNDNTMDDFHITSSNTMSVENAQQNVGYVTTSYDTGSQEDDFQFSIVSGIADGDKFTIDGRGGLRFITPPDARHPTDKNEDNVYRVQVFATGDEMGVETDYQTIKVTVMPDEVDGSLVPIITYLLF